MSDDAKKLIRAKNKQSTKMQILNRMEDGKEIYAQKHFDYDKLMLKIDSMASKGYSFYVVEQKETVNCTETVHVRNLIKNLESEGFKIDLMSYEVYLPWLQRREERIYNPCGDTVNMKWLKIIWSGDGTV